MNEIRILLTGESSGMRRIIEKICANNLSITLLYLSDNKEIINAEDFVVNSAVAAIVKKNSVNVVLLDLGDREFLTMGSAFSLNVFATSVAHKLLELFPQLTIISLLSRGKKMKIYTEFHLNDVGVNQLINAISLIISGRSISV